MAWLRIGDNATTHPLMSKLLMATDFKHPQKNEAFGVLVQLAAVSAGHLTDSVVELGLLAQIAPGRERDVLDTLKRAGLATEEEHDGERIIRLVLDDEEFIHARRREEVQQDRNRAKDKRTPGLLAQVRVRDGDRCRWCSKSVSWTNRSGYRAATYDSLTNHKDSSVDTLVVACKSCNSKRGAGETLTLLDPPTPEEMIYGIQTVEFVNTDPWCQDHGITITQTQPQLPIDTATQAATTRQQQADQGAAPTAAAAPDHRAAPGHAAPGDGGEPVEPPWMSMSLDELDSQPEPGAAPTAAAAQAHGATFGQAATTRQQQADQGAAPTVAAAPEHRAAPGHAAPATEQRGGGESRGGDPGPTQVARVTRPGTSGRDGSGRAGQGRAGVGNGGSGRRRRGKRGGRKS